MTIAATKRVFRELPIGLIDPPELAARSAMDDTKLDELAADMRLKGVLEPLGVAVIGDRYEVIYGHRRRVAAERAGLVTVPCIVYPSKSAYLEGFKYSENRFREELSPADEAILFHDLLERDCGGDVDKLCAQLGEKRSYVENRLLLFAGDPEVFDALQRGKIAIGVAHQLNRCTDEPIRRSFLRNAVQGGATVAIVAGWILDWRKVHDATPPSAAAPAGEPSPAPVPESDVFRCTICGKNHHPHLLKYLPVHDYCKLAILDPLLETYRGGDPLDGTGNDPRRI